MVSLPVDLKMSKTRPYLHGYATFKQMKDGALIIICPICKEYITKFFLVDEKEWNKNTGKYKDHVICKSCYNKLKLEKNPEKDLILNKIYIEVKTMNGDGINFDQSDLENEEAFEKMRMDLKKIRKEFSEGKRNSEYGSSKFI